MEEKKYFLKQGITEPLTRLLYQDSLEDRAKISTDGEEIQNKIIDQNIKHFSTVEDSPLGMGSFLFEAIGPHSTSDFCDRVLDGGLGPTDKEEINFTEAYELLQHMERKKYPLPQTPYQWIKDSISDLLRPADDDSNSDSDNEEPAHSDTLAQAHPLAQPEISLKISREEILKGFKL